jgi:hydroxymethylglutaryl-CoA reductase (NADPH)
MVAIPKFLMKKLYQAGSLQQVNGEISFAIKNCLAPGQMQGVHSLLIGEHQVSVDNIAFQVNQGERRPAAGITAEQPLPIAMNETVTCVVQGLTLAAGKYTLVMELSGEGVGKLKVSVDDELLAV